MPSLSITGCVIKRLVSEQRNISGIGTDSGHSGWSISARRTSLPRIGLGLTALMISWCFCCTMLTPATYVPPCATTTLQQSRPTKEKRLIVQSSGGWNKKRCDVVSTLHSPLPQYNITICNMYVELGCTVHVLGAPWTKMTNKVLTKSSNATRSRFLDPKSQ